MYFKMLWDTCTYITTYLAKSCLNSKGFKCFKNLEIGKLADAGLDQLLNNFNTLGQLL